MKRKYIIANGTREVSVDVSLVTQYEKNMNSFAPVIAEHLLIVAGIDLSLPNRLLSTELERILREEIEVGKDIHEIVSSGRLEEELRAHAET